MTENLVRLSPELVEAVAGLSAGALATPVVHPLDVIKTRLQIHRSTSSRPINSFRLIRSLLQTEHPLSTFYRGLTPNILGNASSWAAFFYFKSMIEGQLQSLHTDQSSHPRSLNPADYFLASGTAGLFTTVVTNPIWVLKTRMLSSDRGTQGAYTSTWAGAKAIIRTEGWRGFYRGLAASCLGVTHGAVQFAVYDPLKRLWQYHIFSISKTAKDHMREAIPAEKMETSATLAISGMSKIIAGTATYPYQVLRSRLQSYDSEERFGRGIRGVVTKVWREEGFRGFYRGLGPNVVRVLPATWATFLIYENVRWALPRWAEKHGMDDKGTL